MRRATVIAVLWLASCSGDGTPRIAIEHVTIAPSPALEAVAGAALSPDDVRSTVEAALSAVPGIAAVAPRRARGARPYDARIEIVYGRAVLGASGGEPPDAARAVVAVDLALSAVGAEGHARDGASWAEPGRPGEAARATLRRALAGAVHKAASEVVLGLVEEAKRDPDLIRDLSSGDARVRDYAVRVLADRRNPAAVPALLERLRDPDGAIVERAMGALAQIGDPRAVGPLIDLGRRRDGAALAQLARVVGDVGGPDAEAYLVTLASGHPEPVVREAAREALADLRARPQRPVASER